MSSTRSSDMSQTRRAGPRDIPGVVAVHQAGFQGFFLTQLGPAFLRQYYAAVLDHPGGILGVVQEESGEVTGFVAGFLDPPEFYRLLRSRRVRLGLAVLPALLRSPGRLRRVLGNMRRTGDAARAPDDARLDCELASITVSPSHARRGYGGDLVRFLLAEAAARGARRVHLTTDAQGNEKVNRFYAELDFTLDGTVQHGDRLMNRYVRDLALAEPVS